MSGPPEVPGSFRVMYGSSIREITTAGMISLEGGQLVLTSNAGRKLFMPLSALTDSKASKDLATTPAERKYLMNITYVLEQSTSLFVRFVNSEDYDETSANSVIDSPAFIHKAKYQAYLKHVIQHGYAVKSEGPVKVSVVKAEPVSTIAPPVVTTTTNATPTPVPSTIPSTSSSSSAVSSIPATTVFVDPIQHNQRLLEAREQMLRDPDYRDLQEQYELTVGARLVPVDFFWRQHFIQVLDYCKRSYVPAPTPAQVGKHQFRSHQAQTEEDKQGLLVEHPEVHLAFIMYVPKHVNETQFWQLYSSSQYAKGGTPSTTQVDTFERQQERGEPEEVFMRLVTEEFGRDIFLIASLYLQYNHRCRENVKKRKKQNSISHVGRDKVAVLQQLIDGCDHSSDLGWSKVPDVELTDKKALAGQRSAYALGIESSKSRAHLTRSLNRLGLQSVMKEGNAGDDHESSKVFGVSLNLLVPEQGLLHRKDHLTEEAVFLSPPIPQNLVQHAVAHVNLPADGFNKLETASQVQESTNEQLNFKRKRAAEFGAEFNGPEQRHSMMSANLPWISSNTVNGDIKFMTVDPRTLTNNTVSGLSMVMLHPAITATTTASSSVNSSRRPGETDPLVKKISTVCIELCRYYWRANEGRKGDKADVSKTVMVNVYGKVVELTKSISQHKLSFSKDNNTIARDQLAFIETMTRQVEQHWLKLTGQTK